MGISKKQIFLSILPLFIFMLLLIFSNLLAYSNMTRFVYSLEKLLVKMPFLSFTASGELILPPALSWAFRFFLSMKASATRLSAQLWTDGYPEFEGKYHWGREELAVCRNDQELYRGQSSDPRLKCHINWIFINPIKIEVLNVNPPVVKYHQFLSPSMVEDFLGETEKRQFGPTKIALKDSLDQDIWQDSLIVNSTAMGQYSTPKIATISHFIQHRISAFNLARAEPFHIKYYQPGGHYAPHLDYIVFNGDQNGGNRLATFMLILKTARLGGGTIFPELGVHFRPQPGDALLWLNMGPNYEVAHSTLHGACPVLEGTKMSVTLWIRSVGQEFRLPCPKVNQLNPQKPPESFELQNLIAQKWQPSYFWTYFQCPSHAQHLPVCRNFKQKMYWQI